MPEGRTMSQIQLPLPSQAARSLTRFVAPETVRTSACGTTMTLTARPPYASSSTPIAGCVVQLLVEPTLAP